MLEFLVHDAERSFGEAGKASRLSFWSFKLMTRTYLPSYHNPPVFPKKSPGPPSNFIVAENYVDYCTWHRYSDFQWLLEHLQADYPGEIFPPIPEKESEGTVDKIKDMFTSGGENEVSSKNAFVSRRIRRLQLFMNYIIEKKLVHENTHLKAFVCMEEPEWVAYKEEVNKASKPKSGWASIKSMFTSAKKATNNHVQYFDDASNIGRVRLVQKRFADSLLVGMKQLLNCVRLTQTDADKKDDEEPRKTANMSVAPSLVYNGHMVKNSTHDHGIVKHVEGNTAYVSWSDSPDEVDAVNIFELRYPQSGVVDPAMFVVEEITSQLESFLLYIQFRNNAAQMEKLVDSMWFWHRYAAAVVQVVDALEAIETERSDTQAAAEKEKKPEKKTELEQKVTELADKFSKAKAAFENDYAFHFRPMQQKAYHQLMLLFGEVSTTLLNDNDWTDRMQRAEASLPLIFDIPPEVQEVMDKQPKEEVKEAAPMPPNAWDAPVPPPPPSQPSSVPEKHADPMSIPAPAPAPQNNSPPANDPVKPASSDPAPAHDWGTPTAAVKDDTPPPLPPPTCSAPPAEEHHDTGFDQAWQSKSDRVPEAAPSAPADDAVPPPLPPPESTPSDDVPPPLPTAPACNPEPTPVTDAVPPPPPAETTVAGDVPPPLPAAPPAQNEYKEDAV